MARRTARKYLLIAAIIAFVVTAGFLAPRLFDRWQEAGRLGMWDQTISDFRLHQTQYQALISQWRDAYKNLDPCGQPPPSPGFVQYGVFEVKADQSYRVGEGLDDEVLPGAQAAKKLHVESKAVESLASELRSVSRNIISQTGNEIRIPTEGNHGVLFAPSACPETRNLEFESRNASNSSDPLIDGSPYVDLVALGNGWYYYAEWR